MSENFVNIGEILQSLRFYKGIDIKDLAEDVCSVDELILIEKNMQDPTIDQLFKFANKLNVQLSDFFDFASAGSVNYVSAVSELINKYKRERNYNAINDVVQREKENPLFNFPSGKQFLVWHEAICLFYLSKSAKRDKVYSIKMLYEAIEITNPSRKGLTEREIEIKMSIALIEKDELSYEKSITILKEIIEDIDKLPALADPKVRLRALFGLSQSLSNIKNYEESLIYSQLGIKQCINDEVLYLLGEFLHQTGINFAYLGNVSTGKEYLIKSLHIFDLQKNEGLANIVRRDLEVLSN